MYQIIPDTIATVDVPDMVRGPGGERDALRSRQGSLHLKPGTMDRVTDDEFKAIKKAGILLRSAVQEYQDGTEQKHKVKPGNREKSTEMKGMRLSTKLKAPVPSKSVPKAKPIPAAGAKKVEVKKATTKKKAPKTRKVKK